MTIGRFLRFFALGLALIVPLNSAQAQWDSLVGRVPRGANTIALFDVQKILASPVAKNEEWSTKFDRMYASGLTSIPPGTNRVLLASQVDLEFMEPIWEVGLVESNSPVPLATVARTHGGTLDEVSGLSAVALPDDSVIVSFDAKTVGAMSPGNRQEVGRWIRAGENNPLSAYLAEGVRFAASGTPIIIALDLQDVVTPVEIRRKLEENPPAALKGKQVDLAEISQVLSTIRGVTLGITFGERPYCAIKVDFFDDTAALSDFGPALLAEVLERRGAMLDDMANWKGKVDGKRVSLEGPLSTDGLRRITSLLSLPTSTMHSATKVEEATAVETPSDPATDMAVATQQYFKSVTRMLDDLRGQRGKSQSVGQIGVWFDNYARKIDRLPMVGVDPEALDYGGYVAATLRDAAMSVKGVGIRTRVRKVEASNQTVTEGYYAGGYRYGRYGAYGGGYGGTYERGLTGAEADSARAQVSSQERAIGAVSVNTLLQDVQDATSDMRRKLTQKYMIEF